MTTGQAKSVLQKVQLIFSESSKNFLTRQRQGKFSEHRVDMMGFVNRRMSKMEDKRRGRRYGSNSGNYNLNIVGYVYFNKNRINSIRCMDGRESISAAI